MGDPALMFSAHWDGRISVVAVGRLIPYGVFNREEAQKNIWHPFAKACKAHHWPAIFQETSLFR
jgi:hypothetical protein